MLPQNEINEINLVLEKMAEVVAEIGPDTKYGNLYPDSVTVSDDVQIVRCNYLVDNSPACLVGRVLAKMGWTTEDLASLKNLSCFTLAVDNERLYRETWQVLAKAQFCQDDNLTWGEALAEARTVAEELKNAV